MQIMENMYIYIYIYIYIIHLPDQAIVNKFPVFQVVVSFPFQSELLTMFNITLISIILN
jgi:hypothetical protein